MVLISTTKMKERAEKAYNQISRNSEGLEICPTRSYLYVSTTVRERFL